MRSRTAQFTFGLAMALAGLGLSGCGSEGNLSKVAGKITLDGEPLPDATVLFSPVQGGSPSAGRTDSEGHYKLTYSGESAGAERGEHYVWISTGHEADPDADPPRPAVPEKVPAAYRSGKGLKAAVGAGTNEINFDLDSRASNALDVPRTARSPDEIRCE